MFAGASVFNHYIVIGMSVVLLDMYAMFVGASTFNQDISDWDVSSVTDMSSMFLVANHLIRPIG